RRSGAPAHDGRRPPLRGLHGAVTRGRYLRFVRGSDRSGRSRATGFVRRSPHAGGYQAVLRSAANREGCAAGDPSRAEQRRDGRAAIRKDDLHTDYVPIGHSVNLAARMEGLATPGTIAVAETTYRATQGYFRFRELGPIAVKGVSEPIRVYELEGVGALRTRLEVSRSRGFTKFVGRTSEMAALESALDQAIAGKAPVVGVVAEPGVGKSRLCHEFLERCRAREVPIYATHGIPHGKSVPFLPMLDYMRTVFGITDQDGPEAARRKIAGLLLL